jgi:hypothetical protein
MRPCPGGCKVFWIELCRYMPYTWVNKYMDGYSTVRGVMLEVRWCRKSGSATGLEPCCASLLGTVDHRVAYGGHWRGT